MLLSRRGFLIGAGTLLTTAFVTDARSFIRRTSRPLLASPAQVVQTIHWYDSLDSGYLLTLGPWMLEPPPPPTWRDFFVSEGVPHQTDEEVEEICCQHGIEPGDFDEPVSELYWHGWFDIEGSPCARAYRLLENIDLGPERDSARAQSLEYYEGAYPGDSSFWVNAKDMLSLSLLQARLIDLRMPIKVAEGDASAV